MHRSIYTCTFKYNFKNLLYSFQPFKNRTTFMKTAYKTRKVMNIDFVCARSLRSCCSTEMLLSHNTDFSRHYRVNESRLEFFGGNYVATTLNSGYKRYKKLSGLTFILNDENNDLI